ncbi:hypothetical protein GGI14_004520 [Coemansia sp. S680]|nr:hypothetical protein GGI14_004520 [Coemansia sp. S680]
MLTNFDCSALWVADSTHLVNALSIHREYFPPAEDSTSFVKNYRDWQLPLGRRFRALKLWFVLRMYGASGIRAHIREHARQAKWLEEKLLADGRFEILAPTVFGLVVFRLKAGAIAKSDQDTNLESLNKANTDLVAYCNEDGRLFMLSTQLKGVVAVRVAIGSSFGTQKNVDLVLDVLKESASRVIAEL